MKNTAREFKIIDGGLGQANTSMVQVTGSSEDFATTSMVGRTDRDEWFEQVGRQLRDIESLNVGWDGYGSDKIPSLTIYFAAMLLANVWAEASSLSFPTIGPMSNGAIMIEWRTATHELTVEVNNPNDVNVLFETLVTGCTDEFHVQSDFAKISEALEQSAKPVHAAVA